MHNPHNAKLQVSLLEKKILYFNFVSLILKTHEKTLSKSTVLVLIITQIIGITVKFVNFLFYNIRIVKSSWNLSCLIQFEEIYTDGLNSFLLMVILR